MWVENSDLIPPEATLFILCTKVYPGRLPSEIRAEDANDIEMHIALWNAEQRVIKAKQDAKNGR